jgi:hypothetical protein
MESSLVIELKTAYVHIVYFVGLTPEEKKNISKVKLGSPEMNSHREKRDT